MVTMRRALKVLTLLTLVIFFTSFFLSYSHTMMTTTWLPRQMVAELLESLRRLLTLSPRPCACARCIRQKHASPWFDKRFDGSMQPLLTAQNALLEEDTYSWWLRLQREKEPSNLNDTIKELFRVVPGDVDPLLARSPMGCRRCAVVGNSGNLRESWYGPQIDSHDFVLRMNKAPTVGFEADVGSKTTHHLMYPESFRELEENVNMVLVPFKTLDLEWVVSATTTGTISHTYIPVPSKIKVKKDQILIYHPAFIKYVFDRWLQGHGRYPSTGILSVIFSLHVCDEVDLYGFGADSKGNWHHYWENNPSAGAFRKTGVHDGDFEFNLTTTLASVHKLRIFTGR
ncbi:CMP-N-acetylneuraminate-beta-galactosamide-alpha-2,3-sialyltransferase 1 isoform X2 [Molossus molossus]|uniref:CMP-N-acetylneuraminate-beta-galactosamide-alpha-2,3-sialyltransferase 1 n=2 Tax=Molossus molossus TaxID=27622 RepID=A0A7J8DV25_MOLMO|nr:CMP-N-acetylneuraminate-beta-galactosamide-alpha-2,3-sialyltransferase 1 isoform X2 [Molossus molossus]XP_036120308.1 CMP-N-acetylneuraminate-beta-galactosamide-alpha-2,3-sialyltransferase 1 isoform X2 [Molossus molossus]XP_036120309.1 CMP-N-acetylneuraminate-beta-galactosamide-alpha-2,3-sialyltransferase 1 isoform X2 [Molossus molossus]XP_036120310.1 CMP-N-acetylneuraminate-beta-galactosamide-alpha-2,3-sialyltransferase 1 isoform X2 [Molossus molossus]XP_036120311.1 CMP-N-acetylneuraminate-